MSVFPLKKGQSWNNCMKSSEFPSTAWKPSSCQGGGTRRWTHSCAQLAVTKLLWDLYCRNALVGNSSPSFIFFVCVKFPLCPHPFSHPAPRLSIHQWTHYVSADFVLAAAITSEQGPRNRRGAFSPPICISPICWQGPRGLCFRLHRQAKQSKTNARFFRLLLDGGGRRS